MIKPEADDDSHKYIEHLQRILHTPGWEEFHDVNKMKEWFAKNRAKFDAAMAPQYEGLGSPSAHIETLLQDFTPQTKFDSPYTNAIFASILEAVRTAAGEINLRLYWPVRLLTSTAVGPSPAAMPTAGEHMLFIGLGTSSFCNYWAKAYTSIVRGIAEKDPFRRFTTSGDVESALKEIPEAMILALRLAVAYATYGSLIGFGEVLQPRSYHAYRTQLLRAMEVFIVSHEFAHFVFHERLDTTKGILDADASRELEYLCDQLAFQISRQVANKEDNFLLFNAIGAIAFLRAMELSEYTRARVLSMQNLVTSPETCQVNEDSSHPTFPERILRLKELAVSLTVEDQREGVAAFVEEYDLIAASLFTMLKRVV